MAGKATDRSVNVVDGALFKPLLVLSAPIVGSQVLQVGYNLADTYWVGRLGPEPVAALGYAWAIIFLMVSLGIGITIAGTVLVAQYKGAEDFTESHHVAGQTFAFVTLISVVLAVAGYLLSPILVDLVGATPGTDPYEMAVGYTRILFLGMVLLFWFFLFDAVCRGWGDTRTPLYLMVISVTINVVIDPFFILGFQDNPVFAWVGLTGLEASLYGATGFEGWGVEGAAVATLIARGFAAFVGIWLLFSGRVGVQPTLGDLWLDRETVTQIVRIGAPTAVELGARSLGLALMTVILAVAGDDAVAAWGIIHRLSSLLFMPALGLSRGTETVVGQNIGAGQKARAKRAVYLSSGVILGVFAVSIAAAYPYAEAIIGFFLDPAAGGNQEVVIGYGASYIRIAGPAYLALGVFQMLLGGIRGSGSTRAAMIFSIFELWVLRLPLAYGLLLWTDLGVEGVWMAVAVSYAGATLVTAAWFVRGTWLGAVVDEETDLTDSDGPQPGGSGDVGSSSMEEESSTDPLDEIPQAEFREPLGRFVERLDGDVSERVGVLCFGDVARGTADRTSDLELFVLVDDAEGVNPVRRSVTDATRDVATESIDGERYAFEVVVESPDRARAREAELREIFRDGVVLVESESLKQVKRESVGPAD